MGLVICASVIFFSFAFYAFINLFLYVFNKKASEKFSSHIVSVCAPRIFSAMSVYKDFNCIRYPDLKSKLPPQYLIFANHQSLLDIPLLMSFLRAGRLRFVAKEELAKVPLISKVIKSQGHALIPRSGNAAKTMRTLDNFARRVRQNNWIPVIFPEGTRSVDGSLGTFYAAGFRRLLEKAPMPVAVCAIDGGYRVSSIEGMLKNLKGGKFRVKILKIFETPKNKHEQAAVLEEGKTLIQKQLDEWRSADNQKK